MVVSTVAEEGQALLSQALASPGPTSQGKGKSWEMSLASPICCADPVGMLEGAAPERRVLAEPRARAGGW